MIHFWVFCLENILRNISGGVVFGSGSLGRVAVSIMRAAITMVTATILKPNLYPSGRESARRPTHIGAATVAGRSTNCRSPPIVPKFRHPKKWPWMIDLIGIDPPYGIAKITT